MNKHKIAWIALAVGIVVVLMLTWLVGVSPRLTHIKDLKPDDCSRRADCADRRKQQENA